MKLTDEDTIVYRIRLARCGKNMTQQQLAEQIGVHSNYIALLERGKRNPSERLVTSIAKITGTTREWILGTSEPQAPYPEIDASCDQTNDDTGTIGYLATIIRQACEQKNWAIAEPDHPRDYPKTDWLPDYWIRIYDGPIRYWAFDLSLCVYKRPDIYNKDGTMSPTLAFANFIANVLFSNPLIRGETKYTLAVPSAEVFNQLLKQIPVVIGNLSIVQIDVSTGELVQEKILCCEERCRQYLDETLHF